MSFGITSAGGCALAGSSAIPFTKIHTLHAACITTAGAEFTSTGISEMMIIRATVSTWWRHCTICRAGTRTILWKPCVLSTVIYVWGFPTSQQQAAPQCVPGCLYPNPYRKHPYPTSSAYKLFQTQKRHGGNNTASTPKHLIGMV